MDNNEFWQLLEAARLEAGNEPAAPAPAIIRRLAQLEPAQVVAFEYRLREWLREADHYNVLAAQKIIDGHVTDDSYLHFRCWLVGQGEAVFTQAVQQPDSLAARLQEPYQEFEELLSVTTEAFRQRTGKTEEDDTFPRSLASAQGLDYDLGSETKGEDWTESQLPKLLPKLWKKFGAA